MDNRAELILALRDEISGGMAKVNAAVGQTRQEIAGLSGAGQQAAVGLTALKDQAAAAGDTVRKALAFAGVAVGLYELASAAKEFSSSVLEVGGKVEVLEGAMYALGDMYGISKVNLDDMVGTLQKMDVPLDTATKAVNSFIKSGLNLGDLPKLALAVKDIAVSQGKSFTETWDAAIQSVVLGSARGLRQIEVNLGDMATVAGKSIKDLEMEAGLTAAQKSQIMFDALMAYAKQFEGVSESATGSYLKQQLKLKNAAEETKVALFDSLKPIATAITGEKIQAWEDLYAWVTANKAALTGYAEGVGVFVERSADGIKTVLEFTAAHKELVWVALEFYGTYKLAAGVLVPAGVAIYNTTVGLKAFAAAQLATTAVVNPAVAAVAGLGGAATTASTGIASASGAAVAANAAFAAWLPTIAAVGIALLALGSMGVKRQIEKTPSLAGDMLTGEAYGAMSEEQRAALRAGGQKADAAALARRRLTTPASPESQESRQKAWEDFQREQKAKQFEEAMQGVREKQLAGMPDKTGAAGAAGGAAAERGLDNFISRMQQETARASGEGMAVLNEWYAKEIKTLDDLAAKGQDVTQGKEALDAAYYSKKGKLDEEFYQLVAKESGNVFAEIDAKYQKDVTRFGDTEEKKAQLAAIWQKNTTVQEIKNDDERLGRQKEYLGQMATYAPLLSEQLALQREILGAEQEQAKNKLNLDYLTGKIGLDEWRQLEALRAQTAEMARQALDRKAWGTQGIGGGVKLFALDLQNESATAVAFGIRDGLKGAKSYADQAITDLIMSPFTKKKMDFKKIGLDIATSIASGMVKTGTTKFFSFLTESALNMASTWQTAQQAMTAASTAGEAARLASASGGAGQTLGILSALGKGTILVEAGRSGAAAFTSVMEALPFPFNAILAPMAAAAAFAATLAFGSGFGGGGGATAARGYPQVSAEISHAGSVVAHQGWLVAHGGLNLAADERHIIAQVGEPIFNRDAWKQIEGVYGPSAFEMFNSGRVPAVPLPVPVAASGGPGGGGSGGPSHIRLTIPITVMTHDGKILLQEKQDVIWKIVQKGHDRHEINIQMPPGRR